MVRSFEYPEGTMFPSLACKFYDRFEKGKLKGVDPNDEEFKESVKRDIEKNSSYSIVQVLENKDNEMWLWGLEL